MCFSHVYTFNKINTYQWFKENTYHLEDSHDPFNKNEAFKRATEKDRYPLGIFYKNNDKKTFEETLKVYKDDELPLYERQVDMQKLEGLIESKRRI